MPTQDYQPIGDEKAGGRAVVKQSCNDIKSINIGG